MFNLTDNPISLIYAKSPEYSTTSAYYTEGYILIRKLNLTKSVMVHYSYDHKSWFTSHATFLTTIKDNHEVWYFKTPSTYSHSSCSFALCYKANGKEHWDSNENMNYSLKWYSPTNVLQNCFVVLDKAFKSTNTFYGNILIKNLAYHKQVKVRYSFNQWETFSEVDAIYSHQLTNKLENWTFSVPIILPCQISFIVYYIVDGITYFDNNFSRYYSI